jgi:anti-anti-sigma factor
VHFRSERVLVDMGGVEFIDSSDMNATLRTRQFCQERGYELYLTPAQRPAQYAFKVSGLSDRLPFREEPPSESS